MSVLEMCALVDELLGQLEKDWNITPVRVYNGSVETSLNAPAFSTSLINLTAASKDTKFSVDQLKEFLDLRTDTAWEGFAGAQTRRRPRKEQFPAAPKEDEERTIKPEEDLKGF